MRAANAEGGIAAIITRNAADYSLSTIPVLSPEEYLAKLDSSPDKV